MATFKIDKSRLSEEDRAQYEALLAKAAVDPEAAQEEMEDEAPPAKPAKKAEAEDMDETKKSESPELTAALERLATLEKSVEMKEFSEIAKKYAALGEKEDELAQTLYEMKKSNEANYNAYIAILDKSLGLVEKSGVFAEIGKNATGTGSGSVQEKVNAKAAEIQKADPSCSYEMAIAKAWESSPELMAEYDAEYSR